MERSLGIRRRSQHRHVAGVASGIADRLAIDPQIVRLAFVVLTFASGVGILIYLACWALLPDGGGGPTWFDRAATGNDDAESDVVRGLAFGAIVLGAVMLFRKVGVWFPLKLMVPVVLTAVGLAIVWRRPSKPRRKPLRHTSEQGLTGLAKDAREYLTEDEWSQRTATRVLLGCLMVFVGAATFLATTGSFRALRQGLLGGFVLAVGFLLIVAPWLLRLITDLDAERRDHIRAEERSIMAAHLHDSVLQTLAIIQKRSHDPRDVVTLARRQERELRAWLYGGVDSGEAATFAGSLAAAAATIESDTGVRIDIVQVGDADDDERVHAIVGAAREAMMNAAKHAGVDEISVYAEATPADSLVRLEIFIRDRGKGFDPSIVDTDRRGIANSIRARLERVDGSATIDSSIGVGTEVQLTVETTTESKSA